jgi:hypothetical protein
MIGQMIAALLLSGKNLKVAADASTSILSTSRHQLSPIFIPKRKKARPKQTNKCAYGKRGSVPQ